VVIKSTYRENYLYTDTIMPGKKGGGKKGKRGGRKHINRPVHRGVRTVQEEGECYAVVKKLYGGPNCEVLCDDGVTRLCVIRNKFRGRGRRDNMITGGKWIMVGIRDWEARSAGKPQKCDLLEVYSDNDKKRLISDNKGNWSLLSSLDEDKIPDMEIGDIIFDDTEDNLEMEQEIKQQAEVQKTGREAVLEQLGDFIDIDDI
jgi:initiation factor 1A